MKYSEFKDLRLSRLGFGTMRLPLLEGGAIDQLQVNDMVRYALDNGVNYFDTAYPYHNGLSEIALGKALSLLAEENPQKYSRDRYFVADKFPGHQAASEYNPRKVFESQLRKCATPYFDFYLFHNVCENCWDVYSSHAQEFISYFMEQKEKGLIRHLGMSTHADLPMLEKILDSEYGKCIEFCQIQLNYLDWKLQKAEQKVRMLNERGIPVWVMEPLRGGLLAKEFTCNGRTVEPRAMVEKAFSWLMEVPGVTMILSGMSSFAQMKDNVSIFSTGDGLSNESRELLAARAGSLMSRVPCTACRYCCDTCPVGLDIPLLIQAYNDMKTQFSFTPQMRIESLPKDKQPYECLNCHTCNRHCPQKINVAEVIQDLCGMLKEHPTWSSICEQREKASIELEAKLNRM